LTDRSALAIDGVLKVNPDLPRYALEKLGR